MNKYLMKLSFIDKFCKHLQYGVVYTVEDMGVSDLTDEDIHYIEGEYNVRVFHTCGVVKFFKKEENEN